MREHQIEALNQRLRERMSKHEPILTRLDEVAGINEVAAHAILAEIGPKLESFPHDGAISAWAGLCPGNNESAGKRHSGRSPVRNHPLKTILVEVAWAAVRKKGSYYKEKYYRLKARRGATRAIVAIAHRTLKAVYHTIKDGVRFRDLGEAFLSSRKKDLKLLHL